jgi:hypothetical protein
VPADFSSFVFLGSYFSDRLRTLAPSYQLQKYRDAGSFVVPIDPGDEDTWGDREHRLAQIAQSTSIYSDVVKVRDEQWWQAVRRGFVTRWADMHAERADALLYAHTLRDVASLAPLVRR